MPIRPTAPRTIAAALAIAVLAFYTSPLGTSAQAQPTAAPAVPTPEQYFGFRMGSDNKLARWDKIVDYMRQVAGATDRLRVRELGRSTNGNPFIALEISSPEALKNLDRYKQLERKLYFQGGAPTDAERDEIFGHGKVVILITCSIHATEIGASQMAVELVHQLATDTSAQVKKILDNVIFLLVPSLNPDGQIMVTDWFNKNVGTPFATSSLPYLYHPYVGHDNNRDMYMFTQKESQLTAKLLWHDWFPSVWLDEHQMGSNGARIFVMPATDPINPNVHPLIYRWNAILGQSQAAALEAAGKEGIIYNSTYTNFWQGAMAWSGWWHNQIGLLTEVASARIAAPIEQRKAVPGQSTPTPPAERERGSGGRGDVPADGVLPAPGDITSRTEYPRPWMGGRWTLRDIVDYELIATMALLDTVADRRETLLRQVYEVNRQTVDAGTTGEIKTIVIPIEGQQDAREAAHLADRLHMAGVEVLRANAAFDADGTRYAAGTFIIPMNQVFARYAKDMLEKQTYPEVRRSPTSAPEPPYDVTAWSLGMLLGVKSVFVKSPHPSGLSVTPVTDLPKIAGDVKGTGPRFGFDVKGPDTASAINVLLKQGAKLVFDAPSHVTATGVSRRQLEEVAADYGLSVTTSDGTPRNASAPPIPFHAPRIGMYQPWGGGSMDEGWTRWVLEQYGFGSTPLHNTDVRAGKLREKYDAIILADQSPKSIVDGASG
ncbi:MAG TPA: M14 metallopeptidase family protein, partial [Gemmatimonadales bacterium]|nr:M14 metallopeptidase family protein [Gemmatimonadales bacterium]